MLREGVEDFEYLWMLREQVRKLRKAGVSGPALDEAEELIRVPEEISTSLTEFTLDPQPIFRRRAKVAEALERLVRMELEAGR